MMYKFRRILPVLLLVFLLAGCGGKTDADVSTVVIEKDGRITSILVEDFSQSYYDETEMKDMIAEEIEAYNNVAGESRITLEEYSVENNIAKLSMHYTSAEDYEAFNGQILFCGTAAEASEQGYQLSGNFYSVKEEAEKEASGLGDLSERKMVVTDESVRIRVWQKISYYTVGASLTGSNEVDTYNNKELTYIIL